MNGEIERYVMFMDVKIQQHSLLIIPPLKLKFNPIVINILTEISTELSKIEFKWIGKLGIKAYPEETQQHRRTWHTRA